MALLVSVGMGNDDCRGTLWVAEALPALPLDEPLS
jgi:hypothetical protein